MILLDSKEVYVYDQCPAYLNISAVTPMQIMTLKNVNFSTIFIGHRKSIEKSMPNFNIDSMLKNRLCPLGNTGEVAIWLLSRYLNLEYVHCIKQFIPWSVNMSFKMLMLSSKGEKRN